MATRRQQHLISLAPPAVTLAEAIKEYLLAKRANQGSPATVAAYADFLRKFTWWCETADCAGNVRLLTVTHIRRFIEYCQTAGARWGSPMPKAQRPLAGSSVRHYYGLLAAFWSWMQREGFISENPFKDGRLERPRAKKKVVPSYAEHDLRALLDTCGKGTLGYRDRALMLVLLDTGLRAAELCSVCLGDVEPGRIKVLGKGAKERYVALGPTAEKALRDYLRKGRPVCEEAHVFLSCRAQPLSASTLYQIIGKRAEAAGIGTRGVHRMRHTFALMAAKSGMPIHALQALLGHESPSMSLRYGRMGTDDACELHKQFSPVQRLNLGQKKHR